MNKSAEVTNIVKRLSKAKAPEKQAELMIKLLADFQFLKTEGENYLTKLHQVALKLDNSKYLGWAHYYKGLYERTKDNPVIALDHLESAISCFASSDDKKGLSKACSGAGLIYFNQSKYVKALQYYNDALTLRKEIKDKQGIASCYNRLGMLYFQQGLYSKALQYFLDSVKIIEQLDNINELPSIYHNIASVYFALENFPKALSYYFEALSKHPESNKREISNTYGNIGAIYRELNNYGESIKYFFKSLQIKKEINHKNGIASTYYNLGNLNMLQGQKSEALKNYFDALELFNEMGNQSSRANTLIKIGDWYLSSSMYSKAIEYISKGLNIAEEINDKSLIKEATKILYKLKKEQNDDREALKYHEKMLDIERKIRKELAGNNITDIEFKYHIELKDNDLNSIVSETDILENKYNNLSEENKINNNILSIVLPAKLHQSIKSKVRREEVLYDYSTVLIIGFRKPGRKSRLPLNHIFTEASKLNVSIEKLAGKYNFNLLNFTKDAIIACSQADKNNDHVKQSLILATEINRYLQDNLISINKGQYTYRIAIHSEKVIEGILGITEFNTDTPGELITAGLLAEETGTNKLITVTQNSYNFLNNPTGFKSVKTIQTYSGKSLKTYLFNPGKGK